VKLFFPVVLLLLGAIGGCATRQPDPLLFPAGTTPLTAGDRARAETTLRELFPAPYRAVHRGVITQRGQQFTCDAMLSVAENRSAHLALVSALGAVTELRLEPQGTCVVLKVTPLFREAWTRKYVARDLRWLSLPPPTITDAARAVDGRILLQALGEDAVTRATYVMSAAGDQWEALELHHPRDGRSDVTVQPARRREDGGPTVPAAYEVVTPRYRLDLRVLEVKHTERELREPTGGVR